jgi:hypothetical protein
LIVANFNDVLERSDRNVDGENGEREADDTDRDRNKRNQGRHQKDGDPEHADRSTQLHAHAVYIGNQYEIFTRNTSCDGALGISRKSRLMLKSPRGSTSARFSFQTT